MMSDCWTITNLLFEDTVFDRPLDWKGATDVYRQIKNIFELKNACDVIVRRCTFREGCDEAQDSYALMLTPTRGGRVTNVLFEDCTVEHAGGFMDVTGVDLSRLCDVRTTGIRWVRGSVNTDHTVYGGSGRTILLTERRRHGGHRGHDHHAQGQLAGLCRRADDGAHPDRGVHDQRGRYGLNLAGGANLSKWAVGVRT
jgi:hypothetical protein